MEPHLSSFQILN